MFDKLDPIKIDPETFLRQHFTLPPLPKVVIQIQKMIHSDAVDLGSVIELIRGDPALVAQILKVVNSAYYGFPREISDIKFAVAYLGLNEVYRIVLSLSVVDALAIKEMRELERFWFHSFHTALCSKLLAKKFEPLLPIDELWPAAILHDIGKLVYLKFFPDHYKALKDYSQKNGCLFSESERLFSFPSSAYIGTLLCDYWRLPKKVRNACEFHSLKDLVAIKGDSVSDGFNRIICLSNLMAVLSLGGLNDEAKRAIVEAIMTNIGYKEPEFMVLMGGIYDLKIEVEKLNR